MFLTLSASEVNWPNLLKLLAKLQVRPQELGVDEDKMNQSYAATLVDNILPRVQFTLNTWLG